MEVRCGQCNKLFRVSDDKITGAGIKFKCTKCGEDVKITIEAFQEYRLSKDAVSVLDTFTPQPQVKPPAPEPAGTEEPAVLGGFDFSEPGGGESAPALGEPVAPQPSSPPSPSSPPRAPKQSVPPVKPAPVAAQTAVPAPPAPPAPSPPAAPAAPARSPAPEKPAAPPVTAVPSGGESSGGGGRFFLIILAILAVSAISYGAIWWFGMQKPLGAAKPGSNIVMPDGLQVTSSLASWDSSNGDLILNITIENQSEQEKPVWYLVADVNDAAGGLLAQVTMVNGKQRFSSREYDIMTRRNVNVQEFRAQLAAQNNIPVPPRGVISVELRVMEPPQGVASFVAAFRPYDSGQLGQEATGAAPQP